MPASRKRKRREAETVAEIEAAVDQNNRRAKTKQKSDEQLFVLDVKPSKGSSRRAAAKTSALNDKAAVTKKASSKRGGLTKLVYATSEDRVVERLAARIDPKAKKTAGPKSTGQSRLKGRKKGFDLWGTDGPGMNATDKVRAAASGDGWDMTLKASDGSSAAEKTHPLWTQPARNSRNTARPDAKKNNKVSSTKHRVSDVEVAVGGQSYHPEFGQYKDLMGKAVAEEEGRLAARAAKMKKYDFVPKEATIEAMLSSSDDESDSEDEGADGMGEVGGSEDGAKKTSNHKKQEKLTQAQRNKIARRKKREWDEKQAKIEKKFLKSINTAEDVMHKLKKAENQSLEGIEQAKKFAAAKLLKRPKPKRGGKVVDDSHIEVSLTEDLAGSMRLLKPEGSAANDRFASLLRRNRFEAGSKAKPRFKERVKSRPRYKEDPKYKDVE